MPTPWGATPKASVPLRKLLKARHAKSMRVARSPDQALDGMRQAAILLPILSRETIGGQGKL